MSARNAAHLARVSCWLPNAIASNRVSVGAASRAFDGADELDLRLRRLSARQAPPVTISPELREYAETPDRFSHVAPGASVERFADERVCIIQGPTWASVSGVRVEAAGVEALVV